jgi:hypothetical protein
MGRRLKASVQQPRTTAKASPCVTVHPSVAKQALRLAQGDPTRIRVLHAHAVLVTNRGADKRSG